MKRGYNVEMRQSFLRVEHSSVVVGLCAFFTGLLTLSSTVFAQHISVVDLRTSPYELRKPLQLDLHKVLNQENFDSPHRDKKDILLSIPNLLTIQKGLQVLRSPEKCSNMMASLNAIVSSMALSPSLKPEALKRFQFYKQCADDRDEKSKSYFFSNLIEPLISEAPSNQEPLSPDASLDAVSNRPLFPLTLKTSTANESWIDLRPILPGKHNFVLSAGFHTLTTHNAIDAETMWFNLDSPQTHSLNPSSTFDENDLFLLGQVNDWRKKKTLVEPLAVDSFLKAIESDALVFIYPDDTFSLWTPNENESAPAVLVQTSMSKDALLTTLRKLFPEEDTPEIKGITTYESPMNDNESELKWWLLGGAVSAVIVTTIVVFGTREPAQRQTIEIAIP